MTKEQIEHLLIKIENAKKEMEELYKKACFDNVLKSAKRTRRTRIELVEDRYTGTLYEMEVEDDDDDVCPVIRESKK
jgi:hypothetical protein